MRADKLKTQFHKFIDGIKDEMVLEYFLTAMSDVASRKNGTDIVDDLRKEFNQTL